MRGLVESAPTQVDIGMCPTPLLTRAAGAGAGQVTTEPQRVEYNGFKICRPRRDLRRLDRHAARRDGAARFATGKGRIVKHAILPPYEKYCTEQFGTLPRKLRSWSTRGNGAGGHIGPDIMRKLGCG